ncbi:hypothetical protein OX283_008675 [Flavobacterium sp. SUN052]|uniref:hypothetical protein n=1 Tax=Flavobacterium sp. SUN052 TaxID=3002441 RepID=UPI00237D6369|nr:hypothetical protein [Flavobacterium sp. SUN052]MEC4004729.1 hypothetical protein [Flavobacterium sp. SUN052]
MKKHIYLFSIFFSLYSLNAQQVQWASKMIKFSSDLGGKQFGIKRILGKPDAFPQGGYSGNAWTPKNALDGKEIIIVGFEKPQTVKQVAVFENLNAGCVTKILVSTDGEKFDAVWSRKIDYKTPSYKATLQGDRSFYFGRKRRKIQEIPSVFNPGIEHAVLDNAVANVVAVRVEFNFALLQGQKQVDAIGISDSETPIEAFINTKSVLETLPNSTLVALDLNNYSIPSLYDNNSKMMVTTTENEKDLIYSFTFENNKWTNKKLETSLNNGKNYNYIEHVNSNFLLKGGIEYNRGTTESGYEIFENKNGNFTSLGQLKIAAYNNYDDYSDATITDDFKTLILAIETDFTQGGTDLYFTTRKEDGTFGMLQNMGKIINSAENEATPQLLSDQKTLLFSSNGFSSYGNNDIFVSYRMDDSWKNWSEPINLGSKINSDSFDGQPFYDEKNEWLYYTTSVDGVTKIKSIAVSKSILMNLK